MSAGTRHTFIYLWPHPPAHSSSSKPADQVKNRYTRPALQSSVFSSHYERSFHTTAERKNWTEAQTYCRKNHTDLVTLHSQGDTQRPEIPKELTWIGLRRSPVKWSNGDDVKYNNSEDFSDGGWKLYCYVMTASGLWDELNCAEIKSFMCYTKGDSGRSLQYTQIQEQRSWREAQSYCREHHSDLVSISTKEQNEDVRTNGSTPFWIGLMHTAWEWSDGACSTFRNWEKEPEEGSDCGYIINGKMGAQECHMTAEVMCYKEEIHLIQENKTWERALDYCNNHYKGLLRIESRHDQRTLEAELKRVLEAELKNSTAPGPVWLGLRQSRLFGFWFWPNGLSVAWSNWEGWSQPEQPLSHICGAIATSGPGKFKWSDQNCLSESYFLCEGKQRLGSPSLFAVVLVLAQWAECGMEQLRRVEPTRAAVVPHLWRHSNKRPGEVQVERPKLPL
ncbi:hypothetical protein SKAU_G00040270 [Synaphobranchus kaupii]|uniref:C-type lectin domain-containing protein n=1 Tax=Synaphobranchus kaupii TaxID=118154 RepID=A0A9Q1G108_SYNKA|nr:hypothetical protein SKAU_G00040270 [Synaphobranchus kaupii]